MNTDHLDIVARHSITAFQRGDFEAARDGLLQVAQAGRAGPQLWLYMALACEKLADEAEMDAAIEQILASQPRDLYALTMKAAMLMRRGDDRAAVSYYKLALNNAPAGSTLPDDLLERLRVAEIEVSDAAQRFRYHLDSHFSAMSVDVEAQMPRFREALDILSERKPIYLQQPTNFYYPGLPQNPFFNSAEFNWVTGLENSMPAIRAEAHAVLRENQGLEPYVKGDEQRPNRGHALLGDPRWSAYHLIGNGEAIGDHAAQCPVTMAALAKVPMPRIAGRSPMALFSVLRAHTHIPPHNGMLNTRVICHLPLIVPHGCRLRVGNEVRSVEAGETMLFDDSIQHEAWNDSDESRVVLIFEVWRPELNEAERAALTALFEAVGTYG